MTRYAVEMQRKAFIASGTVSRAGLRPARAHAALAAVLAGIGLIGAAATAHAQTPKTQDRKTHSAPPAASAPVVVDDVSFVKWSEPKENAFSVDVPAGWKVEGGLYRVARTDTRTGVQVRSPNDDMTVVLGDPGLPLFSVPTLRDQQQGHGEGYSEIFGGNFQREILHYMPALEFNGWYIQNRLGALVEDITIVGEKPLPELAQKLTSIDSRTGLGNGVHARIDAGTTWFTGRVRATGKPIRGGVLSTTRLLYGDAPGYIATWHAEPVIVGCEDGENKAALSKTTLTVFLHMKQTYAENPAWVMKEQQRVGGITAAMKKNLAAQQPKGGGGHVSAGIAAAPGRQNIMDAYWKHNAQRAESAHQFINYIRDEKDVVDPVTGERTTVSDK